jgi:hypothetical protein
MWVLIVLMCVNGVCSEQRTLEFPRREACHAFLYSHPDVRGFCRSAR